MKRSRWPAPILVLLCCGVVARSGTGPAAPAAAERIKIQEARLPQIEAVATREREQVQQWYQSRRAALAREIARPEAARIRSSQRALWVQYADMYFNRPYEPPYFNIGFNPSLQTALLGEAMVEEYLTHEMADLLVDRDFEQKLVQLVEERREVGIPSTTDRTDNGIALSSLLRARAQELLNIVRQVRAQLDVGLAQLENQRKARLDAIMEWEKDLKGQVRGILEYLRQTESRPARFGVVESVGYCPTSGYYCTIEGVDRVLGVGDRVGSVRILKIDPEKVEFAKDGTTWAQTLGAPPQPFWET